LPRSRTRITHATPLPCTDYYLRLIHTLHCPSSPLPVVTVTLPHFAVYVGYIWLRSRTLVHWFTLHHTFVAVYAHAVGLPSAALLPAPHVLRTVPVTYVPFTVHTFALFTFTHGSRFTHTFSSAPAPLHTRFTTRFVGWLPRLVAVWLHLLRAGSAYALLVDCRLLRAALTHFAAPRIVPAAVGLYTRYTVTAFYRFVGYRLPHTVVAVLRVACYTRFILAYAFGSVTRGYALRSLLFFYTWTSHLPPRMRLCHYTFTTVLYHTHTVHHGWLDGCVYRPVHISFAIFYGSVGYALHIYNTPHVHACAHTLSAVWLVGWFTPHAVCTRLALPHIYILGHRYVHTVVQFTCRFHFGWLHTHHTVHLSYAQLYIPWLRTRCARGPRAHARTRLRGSATRGYAALVCSSVLAVVRYGSAGLLYAPHGCVYPAVTVTVGYHSSVTAAATILHVLRFGSATVYRTHTRCRLYRLRACCVTPRWLAVVTFTLLHTVGFTHTTVCYTPVTVYGYYLRSCRWLRYVTPGRYPFPAPHTFTRLVGFTRTVYVRLPIPVRYLLHTHTRLRYTHCLPVLYYRGWLCTTTVTRLVGRVLRLHAHGLHTYGCRWFPVTRLRLVVTTPFTHAVYGYAVVLYRGCYAARVAFGLPHTHTTFGSPLVGTPSGYRLRSRLRLHGCCGLLHFWLVRLHGFGYGYTHVYRFTRATLGYLYNRYTLRFTHTFCVYRLRLHTPVCLPLRAVRFGSGWVTTRLHGLLRFRYGCYVAFTRYRLPPHGCLHTRITAVRLRLLHVLYVRVGWFAHAVVPVYRCTFHGFIRLLRYTHYHCYTVWFAVRSGLQFTVTVRLPTLICLRLVTAHTLDFAHLRLHILLRTLRHGSRLVLVTFARLPRLHFTLRTLPALRTLPVAYIAVTVVVRVWTVTTFYYSSPTHITWLVPFTYVLQLVTLLDFVGRFVPVTGCLRIRFTTLVWLLPRLVVVHTRLLRVYGCSCRLPHVWFVYGYFAVTFTDCLPVSCYTTRTVTLRYRTLRLVTLHTGCTPRRTRLDCHGCYPFYTFTVTFGCVRYRAFGLRLRYVAVTVTVGFTCLRLLRYAFTVAHVLPLPLPHAVHFTAGYLRLRCALPRVTAHYCPLVYVYVHGWFVLLPTVTRRYVYARYWFTAQLPVVGYVTHYTAVYRWIGSFTVRVYTFTARLLLRLRLFWLVGVAYAFLPPVAFVRTRSPLRATAGYTVPFTVPVPRFTIPVYHIQLYRAFTAFCRSRLITLRLFAVGYRFTPLCRCWFCTPSHLRGLRCVNTFAVDALVGSHGCGCTLLPFFILHTWFTFVTPAVTVGRGWLHVTRLRLLRFTRLRFVYAHSRPTHSLVWITVWLRLHRLAFDSPRVHTVAVRVYVRSLPHAFALTPTLSSRLCPIHTPGLRLRLRFGCGYVPVGIWLFPSTHVLPYHGSTGCVTTHGSRTGLVSTTAHYAVATVWLFAGCTQHTLVLLVGSQLLPAVVWFGLRFNWFAVHHVPTPPGLRAPSLRRTLCRAYLPVCSHRTVAVPAVFCCPYPTHTRTCLLPFALVSSHLPVTHTVTPGYPNTTWLLVYAVLFRFFLPPPARLLHGLLRLVVYTVLPRSAVTLFAGWFGSRFVPTPDS